MSILIWICISCALTAAYWAGWQGARIYQSGETLRMQQSADELANAEYERGCRDGCAMGLAHAVSSAKVMLGNTKVLSELAAQRFIVGGMRPNE